jgi:flagellar biosynthesis protein FlhF
MQLKSFSANTVKEAMTMVRETLGEDAIIVATREDRDGKGVRVTAAIEKEDAVYDDFELGTYEDAEEDYLADGWFEADTIDDENALIEKLTDVMLRHAVPEDITDQILSCATVVGMDNPDIALTAALEHLFSFQSLSEKKSGTAYMLVGPPGAGKSLMAAKLAARTVLSGARAAVITTDTIRAGGTEQLSAFTNIMKIKLQKARDAKELRDCMLQAVNMADDIFIDTGAMNPFDKEDMKELARLAAVGDIEPLLVLPAGLDCEESAEMARAYAALGVLSVMPTRIDFSRRLGGLLSAAHFGGMIFSDASHNAQVANGLFSLTPKRMARLLMPESIQAGHSKPRQQQKRKQKEAVG